MSASSDKDDIRRLAAQALLTGAQRASTAGSKPPSMKSIQTEINAVRRERKTKRAKAD